MGFSWAGTVLVLLLPGIPASRTVRPLAVSINASNDFIFGRHQGGAAVPQGGQKRSPLSRACRPHAGVDLKPPKRPSFEMDFSIVIPLAPREAKSLPKIAQMERQAASGEAPQHLQNSVFAKFSNDGKGP